MNELLALAAELDAAGLYDEADLITANLEKLALDAPTIAPANAPQGQSLDLGWKVDALQKIVSQNVHDLWQAVSMIVNTKNYAKIQELSRTLSSATLKLNALSAHASSEIPLKFAEAPSMYATAPSTGVMTPAVTPPSPTVPGAQVANPAHIAANRQAMSQAMNLLQSSLSSNPAGMTAALSRMITEMKQFLQVQ